MATSSDELDLSGKVALVTGAARGLGAATAKRLAAYGARLVLCDKDEQYLEQVTSEIEASSSLNVASYLLDVRDTRKVGAMFEAVATDAGRLDILVNNAGGTFAAPFSEVTPKGESALIAENFTSVTDCIRHSIPLMEDCGGSIVNLTSIEAHRAAPGAAIYAAMKAAVANLTKSLALELAPLRIRVNCVAADVIETEGAKSVGAGLALSDFRWSKQPWPIDGTPDDVAAAILFLSSSMAQFITGTTIHVDGGNLAAGGWKQSDSGAYVI